ncbi:formate dehydrogenase subunit gamma [Selenomonas ruminantium]|uniref:Formate dehydrogenase subunit gamma n=1 Tax=Selenomonas ruminantium TaxID=971 RepID=A0A1I0W5G6_SELRU|nr:cytochrome b/b6 domain-containing protein [Selenomonas ruminantium]SFA83578.1 formate dehydrogenase subunit gamma [Selenomonas ruminantium]
MLVNKKYVKRHQQGFVYLHWINAVCFFMLFLTALPLYADTFKFLYDMFGAKTLQNAHRFFAVIFVLNPVIGLITAREGIWRMFSEVLKFNGKDITFLVKFPLELIGKHPEGIPKQGFYNGGERMNIALQLATWAVLVGSGALLWFGEGLIDNSLRAWMIPLHSLCAGIGFAGSIGHIYLALVANPDSVHGMQDGTIKVDYAHAHHGEWIDDMVKEGKIKQQELNEALKG